MKVEHIAFLRLELLMPLPIMRTSEKSDQRLWKLLFAVEACFRGKQVEEICLELQPNLLSSDLGLDLLGDFELRVRRTDLGLKQ